MEANNFVTKLKADGSSNDQHDLEKVHTSFKELLGKLPAKDKGLFSLNVLCILCRNIDKVPSWCDRIDVKALLTLAIDCVRETRALEQTERVKALACVYHLHKYAVRQPGQLPPELVLKLSYMPFEYDQDKLLTEYCKTYWNLLADRLMYMEKLKSGRRAIIKLLPKLTDDIQKVIHMYDSIQFCNTVLVYLLKKLHFLYNTEYAKDLNGAFGKIFESLSLRKDVKAFKRLPEKEILELYVKFSDCFYVITENATKLNFNDSVLSAAVRTCISFIGHVPEIFHSLQTFYLNSFCCLLTDNDNSSFNETVLNSLIISCETTEKLGYFKAMKATYPYINQLLRVYIEYNLSKSTFTEESQEICLKLIILLLDKLKNTEQLLKCDNCKIKSGLHDALRLSFLAKNFIAACLNSKRNVTSILQPYHIIIAKQHSILTELCRLGCSNHEKCLRKLQTDIHNTAILLNKAEHFESAIKLFDIYLTHEFLHFKTDQDLKNISRALYNKSICELDCKMYETALLDAFLSLIFAQPDGLSSEKYMSLVMDIKAKAVKCTDEDIQMMTVLDACCVSIEKKLYGNLKPFFCNLEFSTLLQHEFSMYAKLWPSIAPVAGVWKSLHDLANGKRYPWMYAHPPSRDALYTTILQTPTYVRTIHNPHFAAILSAILDNLRSGGDVKLQIIEATLLFLKAEMNLAEAAASHEWKIKDQNVDPDCVPCCRTVPHEHAALRPALRAVVLWTAALPHADEVPVDFFSAPLQVLRVSLQQLLHVGMPAHALQLAHVALRIAQRTGDRVAYLEAAGVILSHATRGSEATRQILSLGAEWAGRMLCGEALEPALVFMCDAAILYHNTKQPSTSAKLIRLVQTRLLQQRDVDALPLAVGRLLDAQALGADLSASVNAQRHYLVIGNNDEASTSAKLIRLVQTRLLQQRDVDSSPLAVGRLLDAQALGADLSASVNAQRHYLVIGNNESDWCARHRRSLLLKRCASTATLAVAALARALRLRRRARAAAAALPAAGAGALARLRATAAAVDVCRCDVARETIDQRLKHILGLQTNEHALQKPVQTEPETLFTPLKIDPMRDAQVLRRQISPSITVEYVASYKSPDFYEHETDCSCYACETPGTFILACQLLGMEASVYFRAKEYDIARNYFEGVLDSFCTVENKLKASVKKLKFEKYVLDIVEKIYEKELLNVELEVLIEAAYFELSQKNYSKSDDYIYVRIHEILQVADVDGYTRNEIMNLMTASEVLRKADKITDRVTITDIENDLENLKLTPTKEILKTPEAKPTKPPVFNKVVVDKEELPDLKCKIPVLNFDEPEEQIVPKKKINFKIPVPITSRPVLETITPRPTRSKIKILVTEPSVDIEVPVTPLPDYSKTEFFTPESTPDQFFTPQTSVKTYSKKSLRQNIVKNLEEEFSTKENSKPKDMPNKENVKVSKIQATRSLLEPKSKVETGSLRSLKDRRLKRSTSPGKLPNEEKPRTRRLRQPAVHVDKEKK